MQIGDVKGQKIYGPNLLTDQGLETWIMYPTGWPQTADRDKTVNLRLPVRTTDSDTGTYALRFNGDGNTSTVYTQVDGLTVGDSYTFTGRVKRTGAGTLKLSYNDPATGFWWNFTGASSGTFTAGSGGNPTADQTYTFTPGASYATITSATPQVLVPTGGSIIVYLYSTTNDVYLDNVTLKKDGTGTNVLPYDGGFESWTVIPSQSPASNFLTSWDALKVNYTGSYTGNDTPTMTADASTPQQGDYAAIIGTFSDDALTFALAPTTAVTVVAASTYRLSCFAKYLSSGNGSIILLNDLEPSATKIYNWSGLTWDNYTPGTGGYINGAVANNKYTLALTAAWKLFTSAEFAAPASNKLVPCFVGIETNSLSCYYDNFSLQLVSTPSVARIASWTNESTGSDLGASDIVEEIVTTGGTDKNMRSLSGAGVYTTDFDAFIFGDVIQANDRIRGNQGADVPSGTSLTLTLGNVFEVTGTTQIDQILTTGWQEGSEVTLVFNESVTVRHGIATSGSNVTIKLAGAANFSATADDTLTLVLCSTTAGGQAWREKCRSAI